MYLKDGDWAELDVNTYTIFTYKKIYNNYKSNIIVKKVRHQI